jgi:hypothetical protein
MSSNDTTLAKLSELVRAYEACVEKRRRAAVSGALRIRHDALDCELDEIHATIQRLWAWESIALPTRARAVEPKNAG